MGNPKNTKRVLFIALAICILMMTLSACAGGLRGTYRSQGLISQTFTFSGSDKVTMSAFGINANGTYKINGDKMTITYTIFGMDSTWSCNYSKSGKSVYIDGTEFVKQ